MINWVKKLIIRLSINKKINLEINYYQKFNKNKFEKKIITIKITKLTIITKIKVTLTSTIAIMNLIIGKIKTKIFYK